MKIITKPSVYVLGRTQIDDHQLDNFLGDHDVQGWETDTDCGGEKVAEVAGRTCYMSFAKPRPGGNKAYLDHIKSSGHGSVLEHPTWQLAVAGVSRTLTHELVRHRAGFAYSQLSQRYVDESVCEVVCPKELQEEVSAALKMMATRDMEGLTDMLAKTSLSLSKILTKDWHESEKVVAGLTWLNQMSTSGRAYRELTTYLSDKIKRKRYSHYAQTFGKDESLLSSSEWEKVLTAEEKTAIRKDARQAARSVLPNATETKIIVTANARAWRHFIEMRGSKHAEPEIRALAFQVWRLLSKEAKNLFGDYVWTLDDGFPLDVTTPTRKV